MEYYEIILPLNSQNLSLVYNYKRIWHLEKIKKSATSVTSPSKRKSNWRVAFNQKPFAITAGSPT